ncbi:cytochrome b [Devosia sp. A369]
MAPKSYSLLQIVLHWTIAVLVIFQLLVNGAVQDAFDDRLDGEAVRQVGGALLHVTVGLTILALAGVRLSVRLIRGAPLAHDDKPAIFNWMGYAAHLLLYGFIFAMPLTGALAWFGGNEASAGLHELGRLVLIPVIGIHALGALAEHFYFRNTALVRILKPGQE